MTPAAVLDRDRTDEPLALWSDDASPIAPTDEPATAASRVATPAGHGVERLADAVEGAWSALDAGFATTCLLCGGAMRPRWSAGAGVVGGRCADCGSELE